MWKSVFAFLALLALSPSLAQAEMISQWVQLTPGGAEVRAITTSARCPEIGNGDETVRMQLRGAPDANFPYRLCAAPYSTGASNYSASAAGVTSTQLPPLSAAPQRIIVFGDTGCRIKDQAVQACNDPKAWPFAQIAAEAAALKPDLVIHVGDYLYRETPCPAGNAGCAGSPYGDNWPTWDADFFTPAAPLLAAAPFVFLRGNHEDCTRAGLGWLRLLGPLAFDHAAPCIAHLSPYAVPLGAMTLVAMDNANAPDTTIESDLLPDYRADFAALPAATTPVWLAMHRPIWGAVSGPAGIAVGGNRTIIAALPGAHALDGVALMLAGHIHTFEALNYAGSTPPQLVAGFGGDNLDATPADLSGVNLSGQEVKDGLSLPGFGFLLMTREGDDWRIDVHAVDGTIEEVCHFASRRLDCAKP
jgi:hypothetical protein